MNLPHSGGRIPAGGAANLDRVRQPGVVRNLCQSKTTTLRELLSQRQDLRMNM